MCKRHCAAMLDGLHHCGELLREALRGANSLRFTVPPASISGFLGVLVSVVGLFVFWVVLFVFVFAFHVSRSL